MSLALPESLRLLLPDGKIKNILLEDYLRGVVAAALPADAPLEAQKALAVAARTFAANTHRHTDRDADVCTLRHCQAWNERANPRAARAVLETRSIVATFDDFLIEAFYFDHCDGKTRDAKGVLMGAPGYLMSVTCPCGFASMKGHGIGMCQRGMLAMARLGETYNNILTHYYSGIALQQIGVDKTTRIQGPRPVVRRGASTVSGSSPSKPRTKAKPTPRVEPTEPKTEPHPVEPAPVPEKPAPAAAPSSRSPRPKPKQQPAAQAMEPGQPLAEEPKPKTSVPPTAEPAATAPTPSPEEVVTLNDVHSPEENDLFLFLAVEDVKPPAAPPPVSIDPLQGLRPPPSFDAPPPLSMPEEEGAFEAPLFVPSIPPPPSMPEEDMPSEGEIDFLAPPVGAMPEEPAFTDFVAPPASFIEPDLMDFMPPVERFYTPLDAPPTMPEAMPSFTNSGADETPIAWAPPPPMQESAWAMNQPRVLMDVLPGPRIIAGNLAKPGTLITIRDTRGNSIVTVSGVAKQYGHGGFEAPLTDDGAYQVKFNGTELDVNLENETVFIYYQ